MYIVKARRGTARFCDHHDIRGAREQLTVQSEYFAHQALDPIATHGTTDFSGDRQSQLLACTFVAPQYDDEASRVHATTLVANTAKLEPLTQAVCGP